MKNKLLLTSLLILTMSSYTFAQYINVDFETSGLGASWNWVMDQNDSNPALSFPANPVSGGINTSPTVAQFTALQSGQPWALTYTDDIDAFVFDATNSTIKIMVYKPTISDVGIKFEGASAPIELKVANTVINQWEELTFDFSGSIGNSYNRLVVIPDFGPRMQDNLLYFDNIQIPAPNILPPASPTVAAPTPMAGVCELSIFSDAYNELPGTDFDPNWGQTTDATIVQIAGNNTLQYMNLNYQGTQYTNQDVSSYEFLHVDFWSSSSTALNFYLISPGVENAYNLIPFMVSGEWVSIDIPLNSFTANLTDVIQFKVDGNGPVWFDNLYFHGGTDSNVQMPIAGTANSITCSTTCESGPWSYYEDPSSPGDYLFAIEWGTMNATAKAAATVTIDVQTSTFEAPGNTASSATVVMGRNWNVDLDGTTLAEDVNIKFFYDPQEITDVNNTVATYGTPSGFVWYKNTSGTYTHSSVITAPIVSNTIALTPTANGTENGVTYVQFDGISSFSGGSGGASAGSGALLPVELTYFRANTLNEQVELSWETASEINNDYFQVERSSNGRDFEMVRQIKGIGNSTSFQAYTTIDKNPRNGGNYYRLKQVDLDGAYSYSKIVFLRIENKNDVYVYPNPVNNQLTINYTATAIEKASLMVTSTLGRIVASREVTTTPGENQFNIDLTNVPTGSYFITIQSDSNRVIHKIIKK